MNKAQSPSFEYLFSSYFLILSYFSCIGYRSNSDGVSDKAFKAVFLISLFHLSIQQPMDKQENLYDTTRHECFCQS